MIRARCFFVGYGCISVLAPGSTAPQDSPTISTSTNRITVLNSTNFTYDSNGNLTLDDLYKYKYDAESRLTSTNGGVSYTYDGDGRGVTTSIAIPGRVF